MARARRRPTAPEPRWDLPYTGFVSFLRSPTCTELDRLDADIAVLGVPSDEGSPWKPGARFAPRKIRELSVQFAGRGTVDGQRGYYDIAENRRYLDHERINRRLVDCGDSDIVYTNVRKTFDNITRDVGRILAAGALPVVIGGDHAITYPVVRAFEHRLHVVHFDAHMDYRPFVHGVQWANGNPIRNVSKLATVGSIVQVGIRSLRTRQADVQDSRARGNDIVTVPDFRRRGAARILDQLPQGEPVYVSIDIDVLDLPLVPGCVSAEPNGMQYAELMGILSALAERTRIVGIDVVEVNPLLDVRTGITSYLAAHLAVEFLGRVCEGRHWLAARAGGGDR